MIMDKIETTEPTYLASSNASRRPETGTQQVLGKAFLTSVLLGGSQMRAEAAVLEAISRTDCNVSDGKALIRETIKASIQAEKTSFLTTPDDLEFTLATLAPELRNVVKLLPPLRHCLVLRILAGVSRELCAQILDLGPQQVDDRTASALRELSNATGELWPIDISRMIDLSAAAQRCLTEIAQ